MRLSQLYQTGFVCRVRAWITSTSDSSSSSHRCKQIWTLSFIFVIIILIILTVQVIEGVSDVSAFSKGRNEKEDIRVAQLARGLP